MSNPMNMTSVLTYLKSLESQALASGNADIQNVGAKVTTMLTAADDVVVALRAAAGPLAAQFVNVGIDALAKAEPVFGILVPAEVVIDPAVSGLTAAVENLLLGARANPPQE